MNHSTSIFKITNHENGIVELVLVQQNTDKITPFHIEYFEPFLQLSLDLLQKNEIKGLIYRSQASHTGEGIEPKELLDAATNDLEERLKKTLHLSLSIQKLHKPMVGIIQGNCTGTALSWMLFANHRIAVEKARIGFPEISYGLLPGIGSIVRIQRLIGTEKAISFLTQGRIYKASEAHAIGIVDEVKEMDHALDQAKDWIIQHSNTNIITSFAEQQTIEVESLITQARKKANVLIPAIDACLQILLQSLQLTTEDSLNLENSLLVDVLKNPKTLNIVRMQYYGIQEARNSATTKGSSNFKLDKIGVLGAGMMGSGIAYEAARAGIDVLLKDVELTKAEKGKNYAEKVSAKLVDQGRMNEDKRSQLLNHIHPTENMEDLNKVDVIIEAVFEDQQLKADIIKESLPYLNENGFFASNTTSLPITNLADSSDKPEDFIGLHFFSPVDRMALVEVIRGKKTSDETVSKALEIVHKFGKTPIVVHDGPAFFTSRIFFNYLLEGITMLLEGIPLSTIEHNARAGGFAIGPLAVLDEISLELMVHVYNQLPELHNSQRRAYNYLEKLISQGRNGRKSGKGFYDYPSDGAKKQFWDDPELASSLTLSAEEDIKKRLLHVVALDSYRCLDEKVLEKPMDGDIGSVLGIGYAAHTGGVFGHIDLVGINNFVKDCQRFSSFGEQWDIPTSLIELANKNFSFYSGLSSNWNR